MLCLARRVADDRKDGGLISYCCYPRRGTLPYRCYHDGDEAPSLLRPYRTHHQQTHTHASKIDLLSQDREAPATSRLNQARRKEGGEIPHLGKEGKKPICLEKKPEGKKTRRSSAAHEVEEEEGELRGQSDGELVAVVEVAPRPQRWREWSAGCFPMPRTWRRRRTSSGAGVDAGGCCSLSLSPTITETCREGRREMGWSGGGGWERGEP